MNTIARVGLLLGTYLISFQLKAQDPNIILIMTDDQGWYDVGFNGNNEVKTPNLDKLARLGIIFTRFYAASAVCSPTRASVLTGRNPLRINIPTANSGHMRDQEITLPEILSKRGYRTAHFGKWHLGTLTRKTRDANRGGKEKFIDDYSIPTMNGYDAYFSTESKVPTYDPMVYPVSFKEGESKQYGWEATEKNESTKNYGTSYWVGTEEKSASSLNGEDTELIMNRALPFMKKSIKENKAFFTTIWLHAPHLPVVADERHRNMYQNMDFHKQLYYGAVTAMDEQIGRLWEHLKQLGVEENTILWFCSDNGPELNTPGSAGIFKGKKRSLYEGGVRVPAFVVWPGHLSQGSQVDFPVVTSDYMPTILDILNIPYPDDRPIDGISIWNVLLEKGPLNTRYIGFLFGDQQSWVGNQYKLISQDNGQSFELYDLLKDKREEKNISNENPAIVKKMKADLFTWIRSVDKSKKDYDQVTTTEQKP